MPEERVIESKTIYDGRVLNVRVDTIATDDGQTYQREIFQHPGAVAIVALDEDGRVIMVRQYRAGAGNDLLELPAGGLKPGESREECARRELQEEIGYYPEQLVELGYFWVAASYTTEMITIYLARDLRPSKLRGDDDEQIDIERMPFKKAVGQALSNQINDAKTLIGMLWAARHLGGEP